MHAEQWDKAEAEFQAAIKLEPSLEMGHYGLGQVYMDTKRLPEAVRAYLACRDAFTVEYRPAREQRHGCAARAGR